MFAENVGPEMTRTGEQIEFGNTSCEPVVLYNLLRKHALLGPRPSVCVPLLCKCASCSLQRSASFGGATSGQALVANIIDCKRLSIYRGRGEGRQPSGGGGSCL